MNEPNGLCYGIKIPILRDEPTTPDNPIKIYVFGWEQEGKRRGYGRHFRTLERAVLAADAHRKKTGKDGYHIIGRAIAGYAF
jgi:hypothetical protein